MVKDPNQGGKKQIYGHWSHMRHVNTYYMTAVSCFEICFRGCYEAGICGVSSIPLSQKVLVMDLYQHS